jgi:hypothetical protein
MPKPLDRDREIDAILRLTSGHAIEFFADCGFGKSTLLDWVATHGRSGSGLPIRAVRAKTRGPGDVRNRDFTAGTQPDRR